MTPKPSPDCGSLPLKSRPQYSCLPFLNGARGPGVWLCSFEFGRTDGQKGPKAPRPCNSGEGLALETKEDALGDSRGHSQSDSQVFCRRLLCAWPSDSEIQAVPVGCSSDRRAVGGRCVHDHDHVTRQVMVRLWEACWEPVSLRSHG